MCLSVRRQADELEGIELTFWADMGSKSTLEPNFVVGQSGGRKRRGGGKHGTNPAWIM
jgi:hypothetical protein